LAPDNRKIMIHDGRGQLITGRSKRADQNGAINMGRE